MRRRRRWTRSSLIWAISLATQPDSTIAAIDSGLALLRPGGLMTLCIYHGGDTGFAERDAVLAYLSGLDPRQFTVVVSDFLNRPHHPPLAVLVFKESGHKIL